MEGKNIFPIIFLTVLFCSAITPTFSNNTAELKWLKKKADFAFFPIYRIIETINIFSIANRFSFVTSGRSGLLPLLTFAWCKHSKHLFISPGMSYTPNVSLMSNESIFHH